MKGPAGRTKVVLRHLPPSISQSSLMEQVDSRFACRYNWVSFRPGKASQKHLCYSRAYIDFKRPDDVIEFAEFFDGHVFVNEKGTQFKTIVEYAPSQRVPKECTKKDGREGTILKDPEYLEFLEFLSKPVENLPSAEIQLERKEAERAGAGKEAPVITPLMDYVRQKRAVKSGVRRSISNANSTRRVGGAMVGSSSSLSRRGTQRRKVTSAMYVPRDAAKVGIGKEKSTYIPVSKRDSQLSDRTVSLASATSTDALDEESGGSGAVDSGKKILLLKGKEKEIPQVSGVSSAQQNVASHSENSPISTVLKPNQRREASGRIIRSILLNNDKSQNLSSVVEPEQYPTTNPDKDKRPPRPPRVHLLQKDANGTLEVRAPNDLHTGYTEKQDRRMGNKDRPDRVVWTPRRSDGSRASEETLSSSSSQSAFSSAEGTHVEKGHAVQNSHSQSKSGGNGLGGYSPVNNGSYKRVGRRGSAHIKDSDGYSLAEGKPSRRGSSGYGSHEKQVWVQKPSSGS